jgi:hypothetical protein
MASERKEEKKGYTRGQEQWLIRSVLWEKMVVV